LTSDCIIYQVLITEWIIAYLDIAPGLVIGKEIPCVVVSAYALFDKHVKNESTSFYLDSYVLY